jgi:hypothetical protein
VPLVEMRKYVRREKSITAPSGSCWEIDARGDNDEAASEDSAKMYEKRAKKGRKY